jgi:putative DNA primase/helicase
MTASSSADSRRCSRPSRGPNGDLVLIHRTYIADGPTRKKLLSPVGKGAAVRLFEPTDHLGIAEGIETAVAAHELFGLPTWATISSAIMESFVPPAGVRRLTILADHDTNFAGQLSAFKLAHSLRRFDPDLAIEVKIPPEPDTDWLDVLNGVGVR